MTVAPVPLENPWRAAVSVITTVAPALSVVTALLVYFGWARSDRQARVMGLDVSLFGYSTQDYVLRSVSTLYLPLLLGCAVSLAWLTLHWKLIARLKVPGAQLKRYRRTGWGLVLTGLLACTISLTVAAADSSDVPLLVPLVVATGTAVVRYGTWLIEASSPVVHDVPAWQRASRTVLTGGIVTLALFWQMSIYAQHVVGDGYAQRLERTASTLPRATAYSATPLGIDAPGVTEVAVPSPAGDEATQFRTTGLRLLVKSDGSLFLLHDGWTTSTGTVVVLPDNDAVRWQFGH